MAQRTFVAQNVVTLHDIMENCTYISKKVAVLTHHLQQLEHLGLPLAVLVAGVRVHDVVEGARGPGAHGAGRPRSARVLRVDMEQLYQQRDAPNIRIDITSS
jgi:hypothetical protein